jgi:flagellar biosynthetic protein FliR
MTVTLSAQFAFVFMLIFARFGSMIMAMPGIGDRSVPARVRLAVALLISLIMMPLIGELYGDIPQSFGKVIAAMFSEIIIGGFLGLTARMMTSAMQVAGTAIAFQSGLAFAQNVDPTQGTQSAIIGSFLALLATTLIFTLDLHFLIFAALRDSYVLFKPGALLPLGDMAEAAIKVMSGAFRIGIQLSAPFLVFGLVFYMGLGVLSRLMPQLQVFFLAMPANIMIGFLLLMLLLSSMMMWYFDYFTQTMQMFLAN